MWDELRRMPLAMTGAVIVVLFFVVGALAPYLSPHDPNKISLRDALKPPGSPGFILGTDNNGRDMLSRILHGARISLTIAAISVVTAAAAGGSLGMLAAYYRWLDMPIMRLVDVMLAFPGIIVALTIISILGKGLQNVVVAIAIVEAPQFARLTYGQVLSVKEKTYIEAAVAAGENDAAIMTRYILPNVVAPLIIQASLLMPGAILLTASLSFLGLGVQPPQAEWGSMLSNSLQWLNMAPHMMLFPGLALMAVVFGFNVLGDGLRDAMDPRLKRR